MLCDNGSARLDQWLLVDKNSEEPDAVSHVMCALVRQQALAAHIITQSTKERT